METDLLLALNAAVYATLLAGVVVLLRNRRPAPSEGATPQALTDAIRARFPDLPPGFTLREGLERARELNLGVDWHEVDTAFAAYEAHKFGGLQQEQYPGLMRLASALKRSSR